MPVSPTSSPTTHVSILQHSHQILVFSMNNFLILSARCNLIFLAFVFIGAFLFCFIIPIYVDLLQTSVPHHNHYHLMFKFLWAGNLLCKSL